MRRASDEKVNTFSATNTLQYSKLVDIPDERISDNLRWLLGRWKCLYREPLNTNGLRSDFDFVDYLHVYFPYADTNITTSVYRNPAMRPVAGEFVCRKPKWGNEFEETVGPLGLSGVICVGIDQIWICMPLYRISLSYKSFSRNGINYLVLENRDIRLTFERIDGSKTIAHLLRNSFVLAPIVNYSNEEIDRLELLYQTLEKESRTNRESGYGERKGGTQ
jgi:hypothetical protein